MNIFLFINSKDLSFEQSFIIIILYLIFKDEKNLLFFLMQVTLFFFIYKKTKDKNISFKGFFDDKGIKS